MGHGEKIMKVLNLYAGIGGNRKLWEGVEVTAVEYDPKIAAIYKDFFPDDEVIVGDAHQYLLDHYKEFDFIWSSPPCPTHSKQRLQLITRSAPVYPDMSLYQEIIFLKHFFKGYWVVENVIPYYAPVLPASIEIDRHLFWSNISFPKIEINREFNVNRCTKEDLSTYHGIEIEQKGIDKRKALRNCVHPRVGRHVLDYVNQAALQLKY